MSTIEHRRLAAPHRLAYLKTMPTSSLVALLDDIATVLDDVSVMTKIAAQKTAGVLGDDLALNAEQVSGVRAERELPVVWAVAKGSLRNKLILVPLALLISTLAPWAVTPLLMLGGAFLCFEGVEKIANAWLRPASADQAHREELARALADPQADLVAVEKDKITGAVRTDFILSAEIITITLGTVAAASIGKQLAVLSSVALLMTIGVYGLVAGIVKLDDAGLYLSRQRGRLQGRGGALLLRAAPVLMKGLSIVGTAAMFLVGGGILTHGVPPLHHGIEQLARRVGTLPAIGGALATFTFTALDALVGALVGALVLALVSLGKRALRDRRAAQGG